LRRIPEALASFVRALGLKPDSAEFHSSRATALMELNRLQEAVTGFDRALALDPGYTPAHVSRGVGLMLLKRLEESLASLDRAAALDAGSADAFNNRGMVQLLAGRYPEGWADYEWRWKAKSFAAQRPNVDAPLWQGEDLAGRHILVFCEQGLGDAIQFVRYVRLLAERGAKVTFLTWPSLVRLLKPLAKNAEIVSEIEENTRFDFQCPLLSLPHRCGTDSRSIPSEVPYLAAEPDRIESWKPVIGGHGFRIGIAWQVKRDATQTLHRLRRAFPLAELLPLARLPGVRLISLQKEHGLEQMQDLPAGMTVETLGDGFDSGPDAFLDSAAVMSHLDLILTADTSTAHVAGALGRPVWLMLKYVPDWRWQLDRDDCPWYPTMRLFRQDIDGDWRSVVAKVERELRTRLGQ
jgi:tetratricopeptide (TPR) repeat protein